MHEPVIAAHAIAAALAQNWKEAIRINTALLKKTKNDLESLSRLGYAYLQTGQIAQAKRTYQKILRIDAYHQVAQKNYKKLASIKMKVITKKARTTISPLLFIEEPGKTKIVPLVNLAPLQQLSSLSPGQEVFLKARNHAVEVRSENNIFLGRLPDDLSFKLLKLLAGGNRYQVIVRGVAKNILTVIIREIHRGKRFANQPSFTSTTSYVPLSRTIVASEVPDVTPTGEEEEQSQDTK